MQKYPTQKNLLKAFVFILLLSFNKSNAQGNWALGGSAVYNFQTNGIGAGVRAYIPITYRIAISPQVHYFFPSNPINEIYAGLALQYSLLPERKWDVYPLAGVYYDNWLNSEKFQGTIVKQNNLAEQIGLGIMRGQGCWRPFAECRYDIKWKECNVQLGLLFSFGDCFDDSAPDRCPAYN